MATLSSVIRGLNSSKNNLEARMRRAFLGLRVYLIWEERNKRIFESTCKQIDLIFHKFQVMFYIALHFHEKNHLIFKANWQWPPMFLYGWVGCWVFFCLVRGQCFCYCLLLLLVCFAFYGPLIQWRHCCDLMSRFGRSYGYLCIYFSSLQGCQSPTIAGFYCAGFQVVHPIGMTFFCQDDLMLLVLLD